MNTGNMTDKNEEICECGHPKSYHGVRDIRGIKGMPTGCYNICGLCPDDKMFHKFTPSVPDSLHSQTPSIKHRVREAIRRKDKTRENNSQANTTTNVSLKEIERYKALQGKGCGKMWIIKGTKTPVFCGQNYGKLLLCPDCQKKQGDKIQKELAEKGEIPYGYAYPELDNQDFNLSLKDKIEELKKEIREKAKEKQDEI